MNLDDFAAEYHRLSILVDEGLAELREQGQAFARAERLYRHYKARAWLQAPKGTVPEREAWVNGQISALQTHLNAHQEEAKLARTGVGP